MNMINRAFAGTPFQRALAELERYSVTPDKMTPLDIVLWAVDAGQWERVDVPGFGIVWEGPVSQMPQMGEPVSTFYDPDKAMYHMRVQYATWWGQRVALEKAVEFLQFGQAAGNIICQKCGKKSSVTIKSMSKGVRKGKAAPCGQGFRGWVKCESCASRFLVQVNDPPDSGGLPCAKCGNKTCYPEEDPPSGEEPPAKE